MPVKTSKGEELTAKQGMEMIMKFTPERLHSEIYEWFSGQKDTDAKLGFLLNVDKLCYGGQTNELKTKWYTFVDFYRSDVDAQDLYEEI